MNNLGNSLNQTFEKKDGNGLDAVASVDALARLREAGEGRNRRELAAFYRDAQRKRSPEYMKNLAKLAQLRAKRNLLVKQEAGAVETIKESDGVEATENIDLKEKIDTYEKTETNDSTFGNLAELDREIEDVGSELEKEMPKGSILITFIFWDIYEEVLAQQGLISPGNYSTYTDVEELIKRCGAENNEKAKEQLRRGNSTLHRLGASCMAVEIYLDAICVIYPDGAVTMFRGDPELGV